MALVQSGTASTRGSQALGFAGRCAFIACPVAASLLLLWLLWRYDLPWIGSIDWIPALGVRLSWRVDALSALMLLMITVVGSAVFVYAGGYFAGHSSQRRLYVLLVAFMFAMVGCVVADDVFLLFLCWEATSVLSFLLVGLDHAKSDSRKSAQQALLVTGAGGLALLAGLILLTQLLDTNSISVMVERLPGFAPTPLLTAAMLLLLVGAFTKSAQFPFHFWLPNAMAAPTPVSAYLHSATMVKLGVYLLARMDAGFDTWALWQWLLQGAGSITAAWGMMLALRERDLKRILAWSTVATLGTLVALVGLPGSLATLAVASLLLAHALYKAPLFFVAGNIDHATGTRMIDRLGNLRHAMPWTAAAALLAGTSMAGIPLSFGYVVKDLISHAKRVEGVLVFAPLANTVFSAIAVAIAGVAAVRVFWRHPGNNVTPQAHECGPAMLGPPLALSATGVALGLSSMLLAPIAANTGLALPAQLRVLADNLAGVTGPELLSLAGTFAAGAVVFLLWDPLHRKLRPLGEHIGGFGLAALYERSLSLIPRIAASFTRLTQHGRLPDYMMLAVGVVLAALAVALLTGNAALAWPAWQTPPLGASGASAIIATGAIATALAKDRMVMLLAAGMVGYGSALLFLFTGAPDVALTQFVVETVFVIVIAAVLLALRRAGAANDCTEPRPRWLALLLSAGFATVITVLLLVATAVPFDSSLSDWFARESVPAAHGRNVVNVILVDFRALDTLGEISVVLLSLLAALPLLRAIRQRRSKPESR